MRIRGNNPQKGLPDGGLRDGQVVRGKLTVRNGSATLHHRGGAVRVRVDPSVTVREGLFKVQIRGGKVFLFPAASREGGSLFQSMQEKGAVSGYASLAKKLTLFRSSPQEMAAVVSSPDLYNLFSLLQPHEAERARRLLDLYVRQKKTTHSDRDSDDSYIRGDLSLSEAGFKDFLELLSGAGSGDRGAGSGKGQHPEQGEFFFTLLPVQVEGGEAAIPLLVLGESGRRRRSWLFSECTLSRLGLLRMVLIQDSGYVYGSLFCSPGVLDELKESLSGLPYRVSADSDMAGSFESWPMAAMLDLSEEGGYGKA